MPHITIKVSDELLQHARLASARRNMTVSALLRAFLTTLDKAPSEDRSDSHLFNRYFPPQPEKSMSIEELRLAQLIAWRQR
jgi:hypothetical protein